MKVFVAHPGLQHSHQLATALERAGGLLEFCSGVPVRHPSEPVKTGWGRLRPLTAASIPAGIRRHYPAFPVLRRLLERSPLSGLGPVEAHRVDHLFDRFIAHRVELLRPDMVVCYENSAFATFQAAKRVGAACVLDAASVHFMTAAALSGGGMARDPAWVESRKQAELELADGILTCSGFAADTYLRAGVPEPKVRAVPLGTDLPEVRDSPARSTGRFRFVFVGSLIRRKGLDLVLDALRALRVSGTPAELTVIGGGGDKDLEQVARQADGVRWLGFLRQPFLFDEIARHDCLVLPSRFDSFGMVIPEAMAVGVPALVSDRVGAKCIIEQNPAAGWISACSTDSVYEAMRRIAVLGDALEEHRKAARSAARSYSWEAYHARVLQALRQIQDRTRDGRGG